MEYKIKANLVGERIMVNAFFLKDDKVVHEINTAFNMGATEEEIRAEVERHGELFEAEAKQKKVQKKVDEKQEQAKEVISKLNSQTNETSSK
jgi:uncharacterized protein YdaU (DUF1376 family)